MKFAALSLWEKANNSSIEILWEFLGKKNSLLFGRESLFATIWMVISLSVRLFVVLLRIENFVPLGFIFSFPYMIQILLTKFPYMEGCFPLLTMKLAETILGRLSPIKLAVTIPAHFLGCIFGTVLFKYIAQFAPPEVLEPIIYTESNYTYSFLTETILSAIYISTFIGVPALLSVNKLPQYFLSIFLLPLMFVSVSTASRIGSSFHPAAFYALAHVNGSSSSLHTSAQTVHLVGPLLGGLIAGTISIRFFPDDPASWRYK